MLGTGPWRSRLVLSIATVAAAYLAFAIVAHVVDPRWPPQAFGWIRPGVMMLTWPGAWIDSVLVVSDMNPFPRGWAYFSIWLWSVIAYTALVFAMLTVGNIWSGRRTRTGVAL